VMPVVAGGIVALRPHALDVEVRSPALEGAGAVLEAADCVVAV
jgi:glutaminase